MMTPDEFNALAKGDAVYWDGTNGEQESCTGLVVMCVGRQKQIAFDDGTGTTASSSDETDFVHRLSRISHLRRLELMKAIA